MYQFRENIYGLFTREHCRVKGTSILALALALCFSLLTARAHATCTTLGTCCGGGAFCTCCGTEQEAADIVSQSSGNKCEVTTVILSDGPCVTFNGYIRVVQCDANGKPIGGGSVFFCTPTKCPEDDPCCKSKDPKCCKDPESCECKEKNKNSSGGI